jgi:hypothetical protein
MRGDRHLAHGFQLNSVAAAGPRGARRGPDDGTTATRPLFVGLCLTVIGCDGCKTKLPKSDPTEVRPWDWTNWGPSLWYGDRGGVTTANELNSSYRDCRPRAIGERTTQPPKSDAVTDLA